LTDPVDVGIDALLVAYRQGATVAGTLSEVTSRIAAAEQQGHRDLVAPNPRADELAEQLDEHVRHTGRLVGPLHGVPVAVKDQFETADMPTSFGSDVVVPRLAHEDAVALRQLHAAGAVVVGKAAIADFGLALFSTSSAHGPARNPHDPQRDAGGSSSGSAAAVARGLVVGALAMDTSGSTRVPAAFTGVVGVRPTVGTVPTGGALPVVPAQDSPGPIARTVRDAALLLEALSDGVVRAAEAAPLSLRGRTIGVLRQPCRGRPGRRGG
jgi:amidase